MSDPAAKGAAAEEAAQPPLLLLDGHSLAYRAFFALPTTIVTSTGQITNAVYGFTSMVIKILSEQKTDRIGVAFDVGAPTIRLAEYSEYKAGRAETPGEFRGQLDLIREVLDVLKIPRFGIPDHEADDVLATIARRAQRDGLETVMVTADRDYLQLVDDHIKVLFNRKGVSDYVLYDRDAVVERFGLPPEQLVDFSALKGDPSDNLPSVPGVGDKTASALIQQFGSIEEMYANLDQLPSKLKKLEPVLREHEEQVRLNKKLARLVDDLPEVDVDPATIRMGEWDDAEIRKLFTALQFRTLIERIDEVRAVARPVEAAPAFTVRAHDATLFDAGAAKRVAIAFTPDDDGIAIAENDTEAVWVADPAAMAEMLQDPGVEKVAHDGKALAVRLARKGIALRGLTFDTHVAAYLLDPAPGRYELAELSARYLRRDLPQAAAGPEDEGQLALGFEGGAGDASTVASSHAAALFALADQLEREIDKVGMRELLHDVEIPLIDVLTQLELTGVAIDASPLQSMSADLSKRIDALETQIYEVAGGPFNLNSPPQLRTVLYERLELKPSKRTKTGYSTDAQALEGLRGQHPIVDALLEYRELSKLRSTYLDALPPLIGPDGRVHAIFNQTVAATGRISVEKPNLQNIPVRSDLGRQIRKAFVAGFPDHTLLVADYSQIELRVLAHITGDPGLTAAFEHDEDVHAATAAKIFGFAVDEVPFDLRNRAKAINFGLAYGMNKFGLAQRLGIAPDEAQELIDGYFASFPKVAQFMREVVKDAYKDGCTVTIVGRRRYLPELEHSNPRVRAMGERMALNAPIQGSAADIFKLAMIKTSHGLAREGSKARMVLTVHDELLFEVPNAELPATVELVRDLMQGAYPLKVPLKVDVATGSSWADAKG